MVISGKSLTLRVLQFVDQSLEGIQTLQLVGRIVIHVLQKQVIMSRQRLGHQLQVAVDGIPEYRSRKCLNKWILLHPVAHIRLQKQHIHISPFYCIRNTYSYPIHNIIQRLFSFEELQQFALDLLVSQLVLPDGGSTTEQKFKLLKIEH